MSNWSGNHFNLIPETKGLLDDTIDSIEDTFGGITEETMESAINKMEEMELFYVSFKPDFTMSKMSLLMKQYSQKNSKENSGRIPSTKIYKRRGVSSFESNVRVLKGLWSVSMSKEDKKALKKDIKRNIEYKRAEIAKIINEAQRLEKQKDNIIKISSETAMRSFFAKARMDFGFIVGFTYPGHMHHGINTSIPYSSLILALMAKGYDPLLPIRKARFRDSVNKRMADIIVSTINEWIEHDKKTNIYKTINKRLTREAKLVVDFVKDYIYGGAKPALDKETIRKRKYYASSGKGLYSGDSGINEPLVETGDLAAEVDFVITSSDKEITPDDLRYEYDKATIAPVVKRMLRESERLKNAINSRKSRNMTFKGMMERFKAGDDSVITDIVEREAIADAAGTDYKNTTGLIAISNAKRELRHRLKNLSLLGNLFSYYKNIGGSMTWDVKSMPDNLKEDFMAWFEALRFLRSHDIEVNIDRENMTVDF